MWYNYARFQMHWFSISFKHPFVLALWELAQLLTTSLPLLRLQPGLHHKLPCPTVLCYRGGIIWGPLRQQLSNSYPATFLYAKFLGFAEHWQLHQNFTRPYPFPDLTSSLFCYFPLQSCHPYKQTVLPCVVLFEPPWYSDKFSYKRTDKKHTMLGFSRSHRNRSLRAKNSPPISMPG